MENTDIFQVVFEQFQDGMIILDANNNIIFINEMAKYIRNVETNIVGNNIMQCHSEKSQEKVSSVCPKTT
jgi:transcriptional regulator with PAS, ATPase and Fis domain